MMTIPSSSYHTTPYFGKRNDGASGHVEAPREFSKKQKRRHKLKLKDLEEKKKHDPKKKEKMEALRTQMESPETQEFLKEAEKGVLSMVRETILPDGLQSLLAELDNLEIDPVFLIELQDVTTRLLEQMEKPSGEKNELSIPPSAEEVNAALVLASEKGSKKTVSTFLAAMEHLQIPVYADTVTRVMDTFTDLKEYAYVETFFEKSIDVGANPNSDTWAALVKSKAYAGDIEGAQATMDRLVKIGVTPTPVMYISIFRSLIESKENTKAYDYWLRMKAEGTELNIEAYNYILQHSIQTYNPERSFWYFEEMKGRGIKPDAESFAKLFEACGSAPMWVNGFQDIIFDAMNVMEGAEFPPTTKIYNNIIRSFGQGGDSAAAEFYFWEMRQKNIPQTVETYNCLFGALACGQRVGHGSYMIKPRYVRPPEPTQRNELLDLMLEAGAEKTNEIMASRYTSDGINERGKRQMHPTTSDLDDLDDREVREIMTEALIAAKNHPDYVNRLELLRLRDQDRKHSFENETGRKITLDLLAKGVDPGPGKILHILPPPGEVIEEPTNEDLYIQSSDIDTLTRDKSKPTSDNVGLDQQLHDDLPDDDPELQKFIQSFKSSLGTDSFESMLDALEEKVGPPSDNIYGVTPGSNPLEDLVGADEIDDSLRRKRQRNAQELIRDTERGLIDLDTMVVPEAPQSKSFKEELEELEKKSKLKKELEMKSKKVDEMKSTSTPPAPAPPQQPTSSFNFDSIDLGDPKDLQPKDLPVKRKTINPLLALLDNEPIEEADNSVPDSSSSSSIGTLPNHLKDVTNIQRDETGTIPESEVDRQWNYILFARCPPPDYSKPLLERRKDNFLRAKGLYQDMLEHNITPDVNTLTAYMSVYSEAAKLDESLDILDQFASKHDLVPDENTYLSLIRLHIFIKDMNGALLRLQEMKDRDLQPTGKIYGTLIQTLTHREQLVEALKLLEEAHENKIHISNTYLKKLRKRCEKIGVIHPYIPPDPDQWVKDVKELRKKTKSDPVGSSVQIARSGTFI